jgi:hypothetical protein
VLGEIKTQISFFDTFGSPSLSDTTLAPFTLDITLDLNAFDAPDDVNTLIVGPNGKGAKLLTNFDINEMFA